MRTEAFSSKFLQRDVVQAGAGRVHRNWTLLLVFSVMGVASLVALGGIVTMSIGAVAGLL